MRRKRSNCVNDKTLRQLAKINFYTTVIMFMCLLYYAFMLRETMEWNRDLQDRLNELSESVRNMRRP